MTKLEIDKKSLESHEGTYPRVRVSHKKRIGKKDPRYLLKCGDCPEKLEIYYGEDGESLEINGVLGSVENWREILLPLLNI